MSLSKHDPEVFYYDKLADFLSKHPNYTELDFIRKEIDFYEDFILRVKDDPIVEESVMARYKAYLNYFKDKERFVLNASIVRSIDVEQEIDLSAVQKLIYLKELGVIDLLRKEVCFKTSTNNLAKVLSAITGEDTRTLSSALNPMLNKDVSQKNNPYNTKKTVEKVKNQLINLGFQPK